MIAILLALLAVLIMSVILLTVSVNALVWFLLLAIPFFIAWFGAWLYNERLDMEPPFLWFVLNYGGGVACTVWYIVDYVNDSMDVGFWPVICMVIITALGAPLIALLNRAGEALEALEKKAGALWGKTGFRFGYLLLAILFLVMAVACICVSVSMFLPAIAMLSFAVAFFILAKTPKGSKYIFGKERGYTPKQVMVGAVVIFVVLVVISNV